MLSHGAGGVTGFRHRSAPGGTSLGSLGPLGAADWPNRGAAPAPS